GNAAFTAPPHWTGQAAAVGASSRAIALTEGVLKAMKLDRLRAAATILLFVGLLVAAGGLLAHHALWAAPQQDAAQENVPPRGAQEAEGEPTVVQVTKPLVGRLRTLTGNVRPFEQAEIVATISGVLKGQTVDIGDFV